MGKARVFWLSIPVPRAQLLTSNQRLHWADRARRTRVLRARARAAALVKGLPRDLARVHIVGHVDYPDKRARDVMNIYPTLKAFVDGITDHGLTSDDDDQHVTGPDARPTGNITKGHYTIHLEITEVAN